MQVNLTHAGAQKAVDKGQLTMGDALKKGHRWPSTPALSLPKRRSHRPAEYRISNNEYRSGEDASASTRSGNVTMLARSPHP